MPTDGLTGMPTEAGTRGRQTGEMPDPGREANGKTELIPRGRNGLSGRTVTGDS
jgi:hypothetical protein